MIYTKKDGRIFSVLRNAWESDIYKEVCNDCSHQENCSALLGTIPCKQSAAWIVKKLNAKKKEAK